MRLPLCSRNQIMLRLADRSSEGGRGASGRVVTVAVGFGMRTSVRVALWASAAIMVPSVASAQEAAPDATPATETPAEQSASTIDDKDTLNEVVVTAQRREERLQDVPLSIT